MTHSKHSNPTVAHILNPEFADSNPALRFDRDAHTNRLALGVGLGIRNPWTQLEQLALMQPDRRVALFPDTNVLIKQDAKPLWKALRLFYLQHNRPRAFISAPIYQESREWMFDPWRNKDLATSLRDALHADACGWAQFIDAPKNDHAVHNSLLMYVRLLGLRRQLLDCACEGVLDGIVRTKSEGMNYLQNSVGARGQLMAKKGSLNGTGKTEYSFNDEAHVLLAVYFAIFTGIESVIVTTDKDILEVFYKCQWFLDTHYKAMLTAHLIADGKWPGPETIWCDRNEEAFHGNVRIYPQISPTFREVLPQMFAPVPVHCFYVDPNGTATHLIFMFEREMRRLIEMKGKTGGRCTEKFGTSNIHINLNPIGQHLAGHVGIGLDIPHQVPGCDCAFSHIDCLHAVNSQERGDWGGTRP